ncbi:MAG TPA: hypothetical protein VGV90_15825 [Solirubrobacteraceae bacterium]|nr:hypothetical protein [Solirubrobacteraceae bacterium]
MRDAGLPQKRRQIGPVEARVGVDLERRGLVDQRTRQRRDVRVQLGTVGPGHAVRGPDSALLHERAVSGRVVVAGLDDERDVARRGDERGDDGIAARHAKGAARQEVVLDVDGDERRVGRHARLLSFVGGDGVRRRRQLRAQREQVRRALERRRPGRRHAFALLGGVRAVGLEIRRLVGALAVAHDLAQQRRSGEALPGEMQQVRPVGAARDLMGAGVVDLARRQLHRVAQRRIALRGLLDELVDGAERLAGAQLRADAEHARGHTRRDESRDPLGVEVAGQDDLGVGQPGGVKQVPRRPGQRAVVARVDPDRLQPSARQPLRLDRPPHALQRVVGVDQQRRPGGPRAQRIAEDARLPGPPTRHDLGVRHRAGRRNAEIARGGRRGRAREAGEVGGARRAVRGPETVEAAHREVPHRAARGGPHDLRRVRRDADGIVHRGEQRRLDERRLEARRGQAQQGRRGRHDRPFAYGPYAAREAQVAQAREDRLVERRAVVVGQPPQVRLPEAQARQEGERLVHAGDRQRAVAARRQLERHQIVRRPLVEVVGGHRQAVQIGEERVAGGQRFMGGSTRSRVPKDTGTLRRAGSDVAATSRARRRGRAPRPRTRLRSAPQPCRGGRSRTPRAPSAAARRAPAGGRACRGRCPGRSPAG